MRRTIMIAKEINVADLKETNLQLELDNIIKTKFEAITIGAGCDTDHTMFYDC